MGYYDIVYPILEAWIREHYGEEATYHMVRVSSKMYKLVVVKNQNVIAESDTLKATGPLYWTGKQLVKLLLSIK